MSEELIFRITNYLGHCFTNKNPYFKGVDIRIAKLKTISRNTNLTTIYSPATGDYLPVRALEEVLRVILFRDHILSVDLLIESKYKTSFSEGKPIDTKALGPGVTTEIYNQTVCALVKLGIVKTGTAT